MNNENELTAALATIEKCREITGCPEGVDLQDHLRQLAAENVGLKQIVDSVTDPDNEPQYHEEGMGCGLEDRGITDRYEACYYGWNEAMERIYGEVIPCSEEMDFPATAAYLAGIKTDAVKGIYSFNKVDCCVYLDGDVCMLIDAYEASLREGAK